jgi:Phosphomannose isomerase
MGTHPSLPSKDVETQRTLLDLVQDNQALMSTEITERYGGRLPFLFKVLSIRKALSIQATQQEAGRTAPRARSHKLSRYVQL